MSFRWMTRGLAVAMALMAATTSTAQQAAQAPAKRPFLGGFITETRLLYPLRVQGWEARNEHRYEQAEYGVSIRYVDEAHPDRWLDIYFYPAGVLSDDERRQAFVSTQDALKQAGAQHYQRLDLGRVHDFEIPLGEGDKARTLMASSVDMQITKDEREISSALVELVTDLYFVKGRLSVEAKSLSPAEVRTQLESLVTEIVQRSQFRSTGACWAPPPIRANSRLDPKAEGALASYKVDDKLAAVSFADRVEAVDPESDSARLAQLMAMAMTDRFVQGCDAPESMTPVVPEDMRELRFEYPPPNENTDGTTPRLRSSRRGVS